LSFTRQSALSQISENEIPDLGGSIGGSGPHSDETRSYGFSIGSWDDTNSIVFSGPTNKRGKDNNGDIITNLSNIDSQVLITLIKKDIIFFLYFSITILIKISVPWVNQQFFL
jgi:hypothetical protein